jgi:hypothetical protein
MSTPWADWGGWGLTPDSQGYDANAKDDTLYYALDNGAGLADLALDRSQYGDDMAVSGSRTTEAAPASRFSVANSFAYEFEVDANNADTGRFFEIDCAAAASEPSLQIIAGGIIRIILHNVILSTTLTLPGVSGSDQRFVIAWATEPNPLTTGAADAMRCELRAWNKTTGAYAQAILTTAERAAQTGTVSVWSGNGGANVFGGTPHAVRMSAGRFKPATETHEDFVAQTSSPTLELATRCEFPIVEPGSVLGEAGRLVGPVHFMAAHAVKQNAFRAFSPIVNEAYLNRLEITASTFTEVPTQHRLAEPDAAYTLFSPFLFYRPIPPAATHLRVRVFVKQWNLGGPMRVRCYAFNRPPLGAAVVDMADALVAPFCEATASSTDHGSGGTDGEWLDLGLVAPARNSDGCTWLAFGFDTQGNPGTTVFEVGAIVVEPGVVE